MSESTVPLRTVIAWLLYPLIGGDAWATAADPSEGPFAARIVAYEGLPALFYEDEPPDEHSPGERYSVDELVLRGRIPDPPAPAERRTAGDPYDVVLDLLRPLEGVPVSPDGDASRWVTLRFDRRAIRMMNLRIRWYDDGEYGDDEEVLHLSAFETIITADHWQEAA